MPTRSRVPIASNHTARDAGDPSDCVPAQRVSPFGWPINLRNLRLAELLRCAFVALGLFLAPSNARANGRYPLAQQLLVDPSDPGHLLLRSTYGVLTSDDAGSTWSWLCESGI